MIARSFLILALIYELLQIFVVGVPLSPRPSFLGMMGGSRSDAELKAGIAKFYDEVIYVLNIK